MSAYDGFLDRALDFLGKFILAPFMIIAAPLTIFSLIYFVYMGYEQSQSPVFSLYKNEWQCTSFHEETHCSKGCYTETICDEYARS